MEQGELNSGRIGLLDLSAGLSSAQIFAGSEFSVQVQIKNPFDRPIWIRGVIMSLPTQIYQKRPPTEKTESPESIDFSKVEVDPKLVASIREHNLRINRIRTEIREMEEREARSDEDLVRKQELKQKLDDELASLATDEQILYGRLGYSFLILRAHATMQAERVSLSDRNIIRVEDDSHLRIDRLVSLSTPESYVPLEISLKSREALQPGNTAVATIVLGTAKKLFFMPMRYMALFNVRFSFQPPSDSKDEKDFEQSSVYVNVTSLSLDIRASIWALMIGGFIGGVVGAAARELQRAPVLPGVTEWLDLISRLLVAGILGVAAIILTARKSDTQTILSVEDFWGGTVIGFLIGYSGTAAFQDFT